MPDFGAGPRIFDYSIAAATKTITPLQPYGAIVHKVNIDKVSASDSWVFTVGGQEVGNFLINSTGGNQLLSAPTASAPGNNDLFSFCANILNMPMLYFIPQGQSLVIASAGGATADIHVAYEEVLASAIGAQLMNRPGSGQFYAPLFFSLAASVTATGETAIDTQKGLSFVPNIFKGGTFTAGWQVDIHGLFLQGKGRNTFSGSADHRSITDRLALVRNGQRLFTRTASGGIPLVGTASAAGSANSAYGSDMTPYPDFQHASEGSWRPLDPPLQIRPGDTTNWYLNITGDVTGGADYADAVQVALCTIREV